MNAKIGFLTGLRVWRRQHAQVRLSSAMRGRGGTPSGLEGSPPGSQAPARETSSAATTIAVLRDRAAEAAIGARHHVTGVGTGPLHEHQLDEVAIALPVGDPPVIGFEDQSESFKALHRDSAVFRERHEVNVMVVAGPPAGQEGNTHAADHISKALRWLRPGGRSP